MARVRNDFLPAIQYNTLPNIHDVTNVPKDHASDIADLKALLEKHELDQRVSIKLVHTHFELQLGEIFVSRHIKVPGHGIVNTMQTISSASNPTLYGHHYLVDANGDLTAYEYMDAPGPELPTAFVQDFCCLVKDRGLQHKLGLALKHGEDEHSTRELEVPAQRMCIDVPAYVALPYNPNSFDTTTEFNRVLVNFDDTTNAKVDDEQLTKSHSHHKHCGHTDRGATVSDSLTIVPDGLTHRIDLAGTELSTGSSLFELVQYISVNA